MSEHAEHGGTKLYLFVWFWLLAFTIVEVVLAYLHFSPHVMLTLLVGLSLAKAVLIMAYFMHLRFERLRLVLALIPAMVGCILLMFLAMPDSLRIIQLGR